MGVRYFFASSPQVFNTCVWVKWLSLFASREPQCVRSRKGGGILSIGVKMRFIEKLVVEQTDNWEWSAWPFSSGFKGSSPVKSVKAASYDWLIAVKSWRRDNHKHRHDYGWRTDAHWRFKLVLPPFLPLTPQCLKPAKKSLIFGKRSELSFFLFEKYQKSLILRALCFSLTLLKWDFYFDFSTLCDTRLLTRSVK